MDKANLAQAMASGREFYTAAENVTLTGGAGSDWTPTLGVCTAAIYVGGNGNVKVDYLNGGSGIVYAAVPAGTWIKGAITKVYNTTDGTSASNIIAHY